MTQIRSSNLPRLKAQDTGLSGGAHWGHDIFSHGIEPPGTDASSEFFDIAMVPPGETKKITYHGSIKLRSMEAPGTYTIVSSSAATTFQDVTVTRSLIIKRLPDLGFRELRSIEPATHRAGSVGIGHVWSSLSFAKTAVIADELPEDLTETGVSVMEGPTRTIETILREIATIPGCGSSISARLSELSSQQAEDLESAAVSIESLESLLAFLRSVRGVALPSLSLTPDGNIYASWRKDSRVFSAEFLPENLAGYVLFRPAPGEPGLKLRSTGSAPASQLLGIPETSAAIWVLS